MLDKSCFSAKKMRWAWALFFVSILAACGMDDRPDELREKELAKKGDEIVIGVVWPFASYQEDQFKEGLELALEEIQNQGLAGGRSIRLVMKDDDNSVVKGMEIAEELAADLSISAVIGHRTSTVTVPASKIYDHAGILLLAPAATSPRLTGQVNSLVFRNIPSDVQIGYKLADFLMESGYRHVAIYYANDEYGHGLANAFEDEANRSGLNVIDRVSEFKDQADMRRIVDKWQTLGAEVVMVAADDNEAVPFLRALRAAGFQGPVIGGDGLDSHNVAAAGEFAEGVMAASVYREEAPSGINERFRKNFAEKYGSEPEKWAAQGYDALMLLAHVIGATDSRRPAVWAEYLRRLEQWEGAAGPRSFSEDGNVRNMEIVIKQLHNGQFEILE